MKQPRSILLPVLVLFLTAACASPSPTPPVAPVEIKSTPAAAPAATATQAPPAIQPVPSSTATVEPTLLLSATLTAPPPTAQPTPCSPPPGWPAYTVQAGDTLFSIASNTGISVDQLKMANCLASDTIYAGQALFVPFIPYIPPNLPEPAQSQPFPAQGTVQTLEPPVPPGPSNPTVTVTPESGPPGATFTFKIEHFKSNEPVTIKIIFALTLAVVRQIDSSVDTSGDLTVIYPSPTDASPGRYTVDVAGTTSAASGQFTITNAP